MSEKELKLIEGLIYSVAYTLDAIRPTLIDTRVKEAKDKAEKQLEDCIEKLKEIKKK
jgi:hypothetical protein